MGNTSYVVGVKIDGTTVGLAKAAKEAKRVLDDMGKAAVAQGKIGLTEFGKMAKARELLGVRSEREIQREILRTTAAYGRLAQSGTMSWGDQQRAAKALRTTVEGLNNEMGKLSARQKAMRGFRWAGIGAVAAGGVGATLVPRYAKEMAYDEVLRHMANTAFNDRNTAGRIGGMAGLDAQIKSATVFGGGSRDNAARTLAELFASGAFKPEQIGSILSETVRAGIANNADSLDFAKLASKSSKFGIRPEQIGAMYGIGTYAGQQGSFEIRDMAKWLPAQMAGAGAVGMYGLKDFAKLAAVNQAAMNTAGSADEAGNNVVNLLGKMGSMDTQKDFKKLGIDLPKQFAEGRMKGMDAFDVMGGLLDAQLAKNKNYQAVQKQLSAAGNTQERNAALNAVGNIAQGTVIGKVFQDRQALMGLYAFMQDRKRVAAIATDSMSNTDATVRNADVLRQGPGWAAQQFTNTREAAEHAAMSGLTPAFKSLTEKTTALMVEYPGYTAAVAAATTGLVALAGAAGGMAVMLGLLGGKSAGLAGAGKLGSVLPGGGGAGVGKLAGLGRAAGKLGVLGMAGSLLSELFWTSEEDIARVRTGDAGRARSRYAANDPRRVDRAGAGFQALTAAQIDGEIRVMIDLPPGFGATTTVSGNSRVPIRADVGRTNGAAGY